MVKIAEAQHAAGGNHVALVYTQSRRSGERETQGGGEEDQ